MTTVSVRPARPGWHPTLSVRPSDVRPPRWPARTSAVLATGALGVGAWLGIGATGMAAALEGRALPGSVVAGVDVSAMTWAEAEAALTSAVARRLDRPIVLDAAAGTTRQVTPRELGADADVAAAVASLRSRRADTGILDWVGLRWAGATTAPPVEVAVTPVDPEAVDAAISELAATVDIPVVEASMAYDDQAITFQQPVDGRQVDVAATRAALVAALSGGGTQPGRIDVPLVVTPAASTLAGTGQVLFLDQSDHTLELYEDGALLGEWAVATGARGYGTPTGEYAVGEKRENPTWGNPAPDGWGRSMPAFIGPGPDNPLGVRAINWEGTDHIRFHGTADIASIGTDASHGCVRLANEDVVELFDLVEVGARIISVD